jgi:hypothetical protein
VTGNVLKKRPKCYKNCTKLSAAEEFITCFHQSDQNFVYVLICLGYYLVQGQLVARMNVARPIVARLNVAFTISAPMSPAPMSPPLNVGRLGASNRTYYT